MQIEGLNLLLNWSQNISTIMILTGGLHLALAGIRKVELPPEHLVKRYGETGTSIALFPIGIIQFMSLFVYIWNIAIGVRGPAALPPEYAQYGALFSIAQGGVMAFGGMSAIGQAGRKVPWAVFVGMGTGTIGGLGIWSLASPYLNTAPVLIGAIAIGAILFASTFFITLPGQELTKTAGEFFAFSPVVIGNGTALSVMGVLSAIGLVVL